MSRRGFTLIELMIVAAILGILAAVAVPKFCELFASAKLKSEQGFSTQDVARAKGWCFKNGVPLSDLLKDENKRRSFKRGEPYQKSVTSDASDTINAPKFCPHCGHSLP